MLINTETKVGMVFQSFNLFQNKTVLDNCVIGQTKVLKRRKEEAIEKAMFYLEKVGMKSFAHASSSQLSGGAKTTCSHCACFMYGTRSIVI